jgi:hypothetical protein
VGMCIAGKTAGGYTRPGRGCVYPEDGQEDIGGQVGRNSLVGLFKAVML